MITRRDGKGASMVRFSGVVSEASGSGGRWVECPFDGRQEFGEARARVVATINGHTVRTRLAVYGGATYLGLLKAFREEAGIADGAAVDVTLEADTAPREVVVPDELATAFADAPDAHAAFDAMAFTHRKEYAVWVAEAKQAETRQRRAIKAIDMLRAGEHRS